MPQRTKNLLQLYSLILCCAGASSSLSSSSTSSSNTAIHYLGVFAILNFCFSMEYLKIHLQPALIAESHYSWLIPAMPTDHTALVKQFQQKLLILETQKGQLSLDLHFDCRLLMEYRLLTLAQSNCLLQPTDHIKKQVFRSVFYLFIHVTNKHSMTD